MQEIKGSNNIQVHGDLNIGQKKEAIEDKTLTDHQWIIIKNRVDSMGCQEYPTFQIFRELMAIFAVDKTKDIPAYLYVDAIGVLDEIQGKIDKIKQEKKDNDLKRMYIARIMNMPNLSEIQEYSIRRYGTSYFYNLQTDIVENILSIFEEKQIAPAPSNASIFLKLTKFMKFKNKG